MCSGFIHFRTEICEVQQGTARTSEQITRFSNVTSLHVGGQRVFQNSVVYYSQNTEMGGGEGSLNSVKR